MRNRIFIMRPNGSTTNSMGEEVPAYEVYHPGNKLLIVHEELTEDKQVFWCVDKNGNADLRYNENGKPYAHLLDNSEWAYWAEVKPATGREYEEMQKLRAETTYHVYMRYIPGITHDMFIAYKNKRLNIESVLDYDERHKLLNIVCSEVIR